MDDLDEALSDLEEFGDGYAWRNEAAFALHGRNLEEDLDDPSQHLRWIMNFIEWKDEDFGL